MNYKELPIKTVLSVDNNGTLVYMLQLVNDNGVSILQLTEQEPVDSSMKNAIVLVARGYMAGLRGNEGHNVHATGLHDCNGVAIMDEDLVRYKHEGPHTKHEYWNPEYRVNWKAPCFTLEHCGGGKNSDGAYHSFSRGSGTDFEVIRKGPHHAD